LRWRRLSTQQPLFEHHYTPDEPFNPEYLVPERLVDSREVVVNGIVDVHSLVPTNGP